MRVDPNRKENNFERIDLHFSRYLRNPIVVSLAGPHGKKREKELALFSDIHFCETLSSRGLENKYGHLESFGPSPRTHYGTNAIGYTSRLMRENPNREFYLDFDDTQTKSSFLGETAISQTLEARRTRINVYNLTHLIKEYFAEPSTGRLSREVLGLNLCFSRRNSRKISTNELEASIADKIDKYGIEMELYTVENYGAPRLGDACMTQIAWLLYRG